ncbi:MAG: peptide chain release factor 2 [Spirochaetales bacterium]|nr:peptide chain release factor 2 [Spirochaetales bacterium]
MLEDLQSRFDELNKELTESWRYLDLQVDEKKIKDLEAQTAESDFWNDREKAEKKLSQLKSMQNRFNNWKNIKNSFEDLFAVYEMAVEEKDRSLEKEIDSDLDKLEEKFASAKILELLNEVHDRASAFLTIHSGAGGTEANDWASMLLRMYTRWAEQHGFKAEIIDLLEAEGGVKSVILEVTGEFAYGYLKTEVGIHRLVRISPFDSSARRHTSFASVFCSPVIDDTIEIDIKPDDLRIDTYRAAGAGGQHVNKTDSAVRITHIPTGIVVQCQNERSQHKNKHTAMKVLKSRLYEHELKQREKDKAQMESQKKDIGWGNQIRSYVFQPYTMVKDHRTKFEVGNIQAVMDGQLDGFIQAFLKYLWSEKPDEN